MTTETTLTELISEAMYETYIENGCMGFGEISTFEEAGMLTNDTGIVIKMPDGSEFQVTVKQSR